MRGANVMPTHGLFETKLRANFIKHIHAHFRKNRLTISIFSPFIPLFSSGSKYAKQHPVAYVCLYENPTGSKVTGNCSKSRSK